MDKESSDTSRVALRIKLSVLRDSAAVASEERSALAPTSTTNNQAILFGNEVGAVLDELSINAEDWPQRCLHLRRRVVRRLQGTHRKRDEHLQRRDVSVSGQARCPIHFQTIQGSTLEIVHRSSLRGFTQTEQFFPSIIWEQSTSRDCPAPPPALLLVNSVPFLRIQIS